MRIAMLQVSRSAGLALLVVIAAVAQGCGDSGGVTSLTFQTLAEPGSDVYRSLGAAVAEFNRLHAGTRVTLTGRRQGLLRLMAGIVAQRSADVVDVRTEEVSFLATRGALQPLTAECISLEAEYNARAWQMCFVDRDLYALPWGARPKLLLYNKAAFRSAGLRDDDPPRTWPELLATAEKLTRDTDGDGTPDVYGFALAARRSVDLGRHFAVFIAQLGSSSSLLEFDEHRWVFSRDHVPGQNALAFLLRLRELSPPESVVSDDAAARKLFQFGRAAMVLSGPAGLSPVPGKLKAADIGVGRIPLPVGGRAQCDVGLRHVVVPAFVGGDRRQAALAFVQFLAGRRAGEILATGVDGCTPVVSVRLDLLGGERYRRAPELRLFAEALPQAPAVVPAVVWEGKCLEDWLGEIHSSLLFEGRRRGADDVVTAAYTKGDRAMSCLYTDIGHPSATITLGMFLVAVLIFVAVVYVVSRH